MSLLYTTWYLSYNKNYYHQTYVVSYMSCTCKWDPPWGSLSLARCPLIVIIERDISSVLQTLTIVLL